MEVIGDALDRHYGINMVEFPGVTTAMVCRFSTKTPFLDRDHLASHGADAFKVDLLDTLTSSVIRMLVNLLSSPVLFALSNAEDHESMLSKVEESYPRWKKLVRSHEEYCRRPDDTDLASKLLKRMYRMRGDMLNPEHTELQKLCSLDEVDVKLLGTDEQLMAFTFRPSTMTSLDLLLRGDTSVRDHTGLLAWALPVRSVKGVGGFQFYEERAMRCIRHAAFQHTMGAHRSLEMIFHNRCNILSFLGNEMERQQVSTMMGVLRSMCPSRVMFFLLSEFDRDIMNLFPVFLELEKERAQSLSVDVPQFPKLLFVPVLRHKHWKLWVIHITEADLMRRSSDHLAETIQKIVQMSTFPESCIRPRVPFLLCDSNRPVLSQTPKLVSSLLQPDLFSCGHIMLYNARTIIQKMDRIVKEDGIDLMEWDRIVQKQEAHVQQKPRFFAHCRSFIFSRSAWKHELHADLCSVSLKQMRKRVREITTRSRRNVCSEDVE